MAEVVAQAGFDGIDLTVRKGDHVEPINVKKDLPKAVEKIRAAGMKSVMMVTDLVNIHDKIDREVLETAAEQGVSHYRMAYFQYLENESIPASIQHYQSQLEKLNRINKDLNMVGCYQNHAGTRVMGASIWELYSLMEKAYSHFLGLQYDIRHAVVEGGLSWPRGLQLVKPMIRSLAIKDSKWGKDERGIWRAENVPFGEGMVDFKKFFTILKSYNLNVPVSLHMEYPLGGAESGKKDIEIEPVQIFDAMKRDLKALRELWRSS